MARKYNKGVSAAVIATMEASAKLGLDMEKTVEKIMKNVNLPEHRARAYFRTFVSEKKAPGTIPAKVKAEKKAKPAKTPAKATPATKAETKPAATDRIEALKAAAKKAGVHKETAKAA